MSPKYRHVNIRFPGNGSQREAYAGLTLDEISAGKRQVAIVKIVVQGMELEALCGAEQILLSSRPILYVQVHRETLSQL